MGITIQLTQDKQEQLTIRTRNKMMHTSHLVPFLDELRVEEKGRELRMKFEVDARDRLYGELAMCTEVR